MHSRTPAAHAAQMPRLIRRVLEALPLSLCVNRKFGVAGLVAMAIPMAGAKALCSGLEPGSSRSVSRSVPSAKGLMISTGRPSSLPM